MNAQLKLKKVNISSALLAVFAFLLSVVPVLAAATVDPTFNTVPSKAIREVGSLKQLVQPDGKVVLWGGDYVIGGVSKGQVVRLNADGSVDNTFNYCGCLVSYILNVGLQPDGKLLVAGANGQSRMVRLNPDGSQDASFAASFPIGVGSEFTFVAIQPDGKILATSYGSFGNGFHAGYLVRLNTDGTTDSSFTSIVYDSGRTIWGFVKALALEPSGKFYLATSTVSGPSTSMAFSRRNANGTVDTTWEAPNFTTSGGFPNSAEISGLDIQPDGAVVVGGRFDTVNGAGRKDFVRLMPAGNVDLTFTPPVSMGSGGGRVKVLSNGKILVNYHSTGNGSIARLNSDGSLDNTYVLSPLVSIVSNQYGFDSSERIVFLGISTQQAYRYFRLNPNGDADPTFDPNVTLFGQVRSAVAQSNGKTVVAGSFTQLNGLTRSSIARLNADGTLDPTFDPGTGFNNPPSKLVVQADGKIIAVGDFTTYNGVARGYIARLNADGSLDAAFDLVIGTMATPPLFEVNVQPDQKILIGGWFTSINGTARTGIARLNTDGSLDPSFNPIIAGASIFSIVQQTDGKMMVGGSFSGIDGFNRTNFVRLNANGSLDQTFNAGSVAPISKIVVRPDGKYVCITGGWSPNGIMRRNNDGTNDTSFVSPTFLYSGSSSDMFTSSMVVQSDGSVIVGGKFTTVNGIGRNNLVRLRSNGAVDSLFFSTGTNGAVRDMAEQPDGNVIIAGDFSRILTSSRVGIARIIPGLFVGATPFDYDGDGKSDVSVFRASENQWYILRSSDFGLTQATFAIAGDIPVPADFDGDGRTDIAIWRPSNGDWWSLSTINNQQVNARWGQAGDIPLPSDYDGDGRSDYIVFRPSTNQWLRQSSASPSTFNRVFGQAGDKPVIGDFDGDGKSDVAIYRPSDGNWWWWSSVDNTQRATRWGIETDIPAPADFDGDGKTDFAVYRPSTGVWYILNSSNGTPLIGPFGTTQDKPVPADYDGDGRADIAVFRPSDGVWYLLRSTAGFTGFRWGISTDVPTQNAFLQQ